MIAAAAGAGIAAVAAFLLAGAVARPIRRVALASRRLAAGETHGPLPVEGPAEVASLATGLQSDGGGARSRQGRRAILPALGQPRAEDTARLDPRPRRGAARPSARACRRAPVVVVQEAAAPRAARTRPARPRAAEPAGVLGHAAAGRPCHRRGARPSRGTKTRRARSASPSSPRQPPRRPRRPIRTGCSRCCRT